MRAGYLKTYFLLNTESFTYTRVCGIIFILLPGGGGRRPGKQLCMYVMYGCVCFSLKAAFFFIRTFHATRTSKVCSPF